MFQDIAPKEFCNDFAWVDPEPMDRVLIYRDASVLVSLDANDALHFPSYQALCDAGVVERKAGVRGEAAPGEPSAAPVAAQSAAPTAESVVSAVAPATAQHAAPDSPSSAPAFSAAALPMRADGIDLHALFLFTVGDTAYFRCAVHNEALEAFADAGAWRFMPIGALHQHAPRHRAFAGMVGYEYHQWYDTRRFCGRCGTRMVHDTVERMLRCPECGCMEFSRLFPAVIVGIVDRQRDRVLVSRYANRENKRYALIAGFCEMGETVEQTVHREVKEEVGLAVKNLRYYASQPWPPSSSLLFGFFCDLDGAASITLDHHELEHAEWLERADLPKGESDYSLTREMMRVLREGRETDYPVSS